MISVIIPTLNEEQALPSLLESLRREITENEIIVIDGGSIDRTVAIAEHFGAKVVALPSGRRGSQLAVGVREASGKILLFLHADTTFPFGGLARISDRLASDSRVIGGNFRLLFDGDTAFSRWLTGFYAWIRWVGLYYGDSGIFVRRDVYDAVGGFRSIAVMDDLDFARRLERFGKTCCIVEPALTTSSRRFEGRHPAAIVYGWIKLHVLFWLGVSPDRLAAMYRTQAPRISSGRSAGR
jgi:rSAM/selenodomain-associated transferase 2